MARRRINITKYEIIQAATKAFLEAGYSETSVRSVAAHLDMAPGLLMYHYPTKEHMLAALVEMLCSFQWTMTEKEADEGFSSVMAICLELTAMAVMCEEDAAARDVYLSAYQSPLCLEIIKKNDAERATKVFGDFCPDWQEEDFAEAEILVSGIEYATLMASESPVSLETRIAGALNQILTVYNVPEEMRKQKIGRVLSMDYREIGRRMLEDFKEYVKEANEQALLDLLKRKQIAQ